MGHSASPLAADNARENSRGLAAPGMCVDSGISLRGLSIPGFSLAAEKNAASVVSLPIFPELTAEEVDYVIAKVREWDQAKA